MSAASVSIVNMSASSARCALSTTELWQRTDRDRKRAKAAQRLSRLPALPISEGDPAWSAPLGERPHFVRSKRCTQQVLAYFEHELRTS